MATEPNRRQRTRGGHVDLAEFTGKIAPTSTSPVASQPAAPPAEPAAPPQRDPEPTPQPAPEPAAQATEPEPEPPAAPAEAPRRQQQSRRPRERAATQQHAPSQDVDLSRVLASQPVTADDQPPRSLSLQEMLSLRKRRVDPMNDFAADGTRMLTWVQDAVRLVSDLTGYTQQEVLRDAVLGIRPLPAELLDETFANRYGYPRPREMR